MHSIQDVEDASYPRRINTLQLVLFGYFIICAGPFGEEVAIKGGGPLLGLLGFVFIALAWSIPQGLMTLELSAMMPHNGGLTIWTERAFGKLGGWMASYNSIFSVFFDAPLYPILMVSYLTTLVKLTFWQQYAAKVGITAIACALNLGGITMLSSVFAILMISILIPFSIVFGFKASEMSPSQWIVVPPKSKLNIGLSLSTIMWGNTGWDSLGSVAGEVKNPQKTYPRAVVILAFLILATYVLPTLPGLTTSTDQEVWVDGYFSTVAASVFPWLGIWVSVAAVLASFGNMVCVLTSGTRVVWAMGKVTKFLPGIFGWTWKPLGHKNPTAAILFHFLTTSALVFLPFDFLVQVDTFLNSVTLLIESFAFLWLRIKEPEVSRPYKVPCGIFGALMVSLSKVLVVTIMLVFTSQKVWATGIIFNLFFVLFYITATLIRDMCPKLACCLEKTEKAETIIDSNIY